MEPTPAAPIGSRLVGIDLLRGLAVLVVVLSHMPFNAGAHDAQGNAVAATAAWFDRLSSYGVYGVQLFLVISGFCIHMQWARRRDHSLAPAFLPFWRRRLGRLYPPYIITVALSLGLLALYYGRFAPRPDPSWVGLFGYTSAARFGVDLLTLVFLCQNLTDVSNRVVNAPLWSLALEEQLYFLYFPLLAARRRWGWRGALPLTAAVALGWNLLGFLLHREIGWWFKVGPSRWFEWALGALAVEVHLGLVTLPRWLKSRGLLVAALAFAFALSPSTGLELDRWGAIVIRDPAFGVAFFLLICHTVDREKRGFGPWLPWARGLALVGVWSYSIYLIHAPFLPAIKVVLFRLGVHQPIAVVAGRYAIALLVGVAFHYAVERRFLNSSSRARPT